ncbi:MAG: insulinase family protein, partial [Nannocystaceae bacterium]|nr:insulinase family protein [Nannocystaceae bacterium]
MRAGPFGVWLLLFLVVLTVGRSANAAPGRVAILRFEDDPIGVVQMRLPNGLTVLLSENHERSEIFGAVVVRAGGKNDPAEHTGIAHYLEHMLFKGTDELGTIDYAQERPHLDEIERLYNEYAAARTDAARDRLQHAIDDAAQKAAKWAIPNELDHLLAELGGTEVNAFTTNDITAYYNLFPSSQLSTWLDIYAHRFEAPVFRLFPSELEAVYEEKNRSMDGFMEPAYEAFIRSLYPGHPYGEQPVLGTVEHLKRPSLTAMREFYERYYVASNMALVLSGDFEAASIAPMIAAKFGGWETGQPANLALPEVKPLSGRVSETQRLTPIRAAAFAFRTPALAHEDYPALKVAQRVLANDEGAGTLDRLVDDGKLLLAMLIPLNFHDHDGLVLLYAPRIVSQSMRRAEALVRGAIDELRQGKVAATTIEAARDNLLREIGAQWEDNRTRALTMADTWARHDSWETYVAMIAGVRSVTPAQVAAAADTWLGDNYLSFHSRLGRHRPGKLDKP